MRIVIRCLAFALVLTGSLCAQNPFEQGSAGGLQPFLGRWEISLKPPGAEPRPFAVIEIASQAGQLTIKVISSTAPPSVALAFKDARVQGEEISFTMDTGSPINLQGRRVGDRLELTSENDSMRQEWVGIRTTKDKAEPPPESPDQKAFNAAMRAPSTERAAALKKFIADFPDSSLKERALLQIATSLRDSKERQAALQKFLADFPNSSLKDQASYQLAGAVRDPEQRLAAMKKFMADFPKSTFIDMAAIRVFDAMARKKPADEAAIGKLIDDYINSMPAPPTPDAPFNRRSNAYNTIADRLMENDLMLDRALELIQKAVAAITEKMPAQTRAMYITTLGQVYYKRKEFDKAEEALKKAMATGGDDGSGEAQLYLGKIYDSKGENDAALDAYFKAATMLNNADLKSSLEKAYTKKYGSLDGLHEKIDAALLAKPKRFDPGHYERPAGAEAGHVVLAELFTGSECGPCVASDLAFDGLLERFDRKTVAVLEYHLHIPGPDPMTNPDTERRARYYDVNATPTAVIDGTDKQIGGGPASVSSRTFDSYKGKVEKRAVTRATVSISTLELSKEGTAVTVSLEVKPQPDASKGLEKARLRIALAEEVVHYTGSNGIHFHHFVVRKLVGPEDGIPVQPDRTTRFSASADLSDFSSAQKEYLEKYEKDQADSRPGFKFQEKLINVDGRQLIAVAFVQNDETREILQASFAR
jgi:tetratricopeptide (TPR) repeat protein